MNIQAAIASGFKHYAQFSGRSSRAAYWYWVLFYVLLDMVCMVLDNTFMPRHSGDHGPIELIFLILMLVPTIAVSVRRLHDINRRGWWIAIGIIPIVGLIVLVIWHSTQGTQGDNRFGADPLVAGH